MRLVRRYALNTLLACGMLLLPLPFSSFVIAKENPEWIDANTLYSHVERLARIPRPPATETEFAAAVYVEDTLRSYGYQTSLQPFSYYTYRNPSTQSLSIEGWPDQKWNVKGLTFGPNGAGRGLIVVCGQGTATDFQRVDARGKIAFVKRGTITFAEKVRQAAAAGAVAVIISNDRDEEWRGSLKEPLDMSVPVIALSREQSRLLLDRLRTDGQLEAAVKVDGGLTSKQTSYNIIASRKPSEVSTGQVVMVSAHHDSAPQSPGANNGASGVAVLLEVARILAERPIDTELRLVSFGAVSAGERGPRAYAESLTDADKRKIIAAFCLDGVGSQDEGDLIAATQDKAENLPARLAVQGGALFSTAWGEREDGVGDHQPLAAAGIPSALITRAPADAWRDQPEDTLDKVSQERLTQAAQVMMSAVTLITGTDSPAFPDQVGRGAKKAVDLNEEYQ